MLASPLSHRVLAALAGALAFTLGSFLAFGTYTRHVTVAGQLVPERGVIAVPAPQAGVIVRKHVDEGSRVERGDVLFVVSGEIGRAHV